jgi:hypothetical protein
MGTSVAVYQPRYYPRLHYLARAQMVDTFVLYDDVEFSRQSPQHRAQIEFGGKKWLTIPVKHTGNETLIVDAKIDMNQHWRRTHVNTIKAKYGGDAAAEFEPFYEALNDEANLVELTVPILEELFDRFNIGSSVVRSSQIDFEQTDNPSINLVRLIKELDGTEYVSGGRGYENYLDESEFDEQGISVTVQDWDPKWDGGNVCSLDVLFGTDNPSKYVR